MFSPEIKSVGTISEDSALTEFIESEVRLAFEKPESPQFSFPVSEAVQSLFEILHHRLGDADLDAVGNQVLQAFQSYRERTDFLNLPDRLEAFLKFIQRLLKSTGFEKPLGVPSRDRVFLPEVLLALGLTDDATVGEQPLEKLDGKPRFAFHVGRAVKARNEVHRARAYSAREKAEVFESVCVVMVFAVCEFKEKISLAILASHHRQLLERYRDTFDKWRERFVDLEGREQLTDEFEGIDPLAVEMVEDDADLENEASEAQDPSDETRLGGTIPDQRRGLVRDLVRDVPKLVLLGGPGSGKTTALQYLAWHAASGLLKKPGGDWWFPIYIPLKTFASGKSPTIEAAIQSEMDGMSVKQLAKQRCLLLLDGLNEVPQEHLIAAKHEIQSLLSLGDNVRVVMTCRPGQFQNEFGLPAFELQPLTDEQIRRFLQRHLRDDDKVRKLWAVMKRHLKLWEWARNPFMLAMLVRVFLRKGNIPENRGRLMQAFLGDIMRREHAQGAAKTPLETKTTLLAGLAFETRKLAMLSFTRIEACTWVKQKRDELGSTLDAPLFVDEVLNNNLLSETSGGLLTFDHELYQEYFCAVALLELGDKGVTLIEELQQEPRWEEPIVIYSGISDRRSSVLQSLAIANILLAAKSLTSAAVEEGADRDNIVLKAKALAAEAADPSKVAEALLSLAELGEAEEMITVLKQRGAQDVTAQTAIRSFIPKCPPDLVVGWMQKTSDHSDKFLIGWMLAAIAPDQKEVLLRDHRAALKELLLWQVRRSWQGKKERRHLQRLLRFLGEEFGDWFGKSVAKDILARIDYGGEDQWQALKNLDQEGAELGDPHIRRSLFTAALNRCEWYSIDVAVLIWSCHLSGQDLSFVLKSVHEETLRRALRMLRKTKGIDQHRLSLSLATLLRERGLRRLRACFKNAIFRFIVIVQGFRVL